MRRYGVHQRHRGRQMFACFADQLVERGSEFGDLPAGEYLLHPDAVLLQQLLRYEQLPPRRVEWPENSSGSQPTDSAKRFTMCAKVPSDNCLPVSASLRLRLKK